jgi:hypothetical protein
LLAKKFYKRCIVFTQLYRNPPELKTQKVTATDPPSDRARTGETRCKSMGSPAAAGRTVAQSLLGVNDRVEFVQNQYMERTAWDPTSI